MEQPLPLTAADRQRTAYLESLLAERSLSPVDLATRTGRSEDYIADLLEYHRPMMAPDIEAFAEALGVGVELFFALPVIGRGTVQADKRLGRYVEHHRHQRGLSQRELGRLVGVSKQSVSLVERSETGIAPGNLPLYAKALRVDVKELTKRLMWYDDSRRRPAASTIDPPPSGEADALPPPAE